MLLLCSPRSGSWEAVKGLPSDMQVKKVRNAEEKDAMMSLLSSSEIDHEQSVFLYNKVVLHSYITYCQYRLTVW